MQRPIPSGNPALGIGNRPIHYIHPSFNGKSPCGLLADEPGIFTKNAEFVTCDHAPIAGTVPCKQVADFMK